MVSYISSIIQALPVSDVKLQQIIRAQENDSVCRKLKKHILEGWPEIKYLILTKPYWNCRGEFSIVQNGMNGDFARFAKKWDIQLRSSSPYYPQSNGEAERVINEKKAANNDSCFSYFTKVAGSHKAERQRNCLPTKAARLLQYTTSCKTVTCSVYRTRSENHESRETRTPTSEVKRNRIQIMPLPPSPPTAATTLSEESSKSVSQDVPPLKISSRSKRLIKPSRKALENIGI
eukprot:gene16659-8097_t